MPVSRNYLYRLNLSQTLAIPPSGGHRAQLTIVSGFGRLDADIVSLYQLDIAYGLCSDPYEAQSQNRKTKLPENVHCDRIPSGSKT